MPKIREVFIEESGKLLDPQVAPRIESSSLTGWTGQPALMRAAHQHDDLELNLVAEGGSMVYLFGGVPVEVGPGGVAAFWAAVPHQLVANSATRAHWVHLPFATFLGWGLPDGLVSRLLSGAPLVSPPSAAAPADPAYFARWAADLASDDAERHRIAMLEIEARVRRLALVTPEEPGHRSFPVGGDVSLRQVVTMMRYIAEHFRDPLTVAGIAGVVHLHPHYAMAQFRKVARTTMGGYLAQCRLADARRLLITTDLPIGQVAAASGFGSVSRFYPAFRSACGIPPAAFRRTHRHG